MPKVIPFGNRILVKRRQVGEKAGSIYLPDNIKERPIDLADVTCVPELTFGDQYIVEHSEDIIKSMTQKIKEGDSHALTALLELNQFLKIKSIRVGDAVFVSKYVGTDFHGTGDKEYQTLLLAEHVIGLVIEDGK